MKKMIVILLACVLGIAIILKDKKSNTEPIDLNVNAKAMLLMDADTGKVIYQKNSETPLPIASMSKLMTQYLVLDAIKSNSLTWESTYEPSEHVQRLFGSTAIVKLGMKPGNTYTVKELFTAMTVASANDAAIALAEMVGGTEESFVELMNDQAVKFGMKETTYFNASGLDGNYVGQGKEQTNLSSAQDVAVIAQKLIGKYPEVLEFTKMTSFQTSEGITLWSTNLMLAGMPQAMLGIDGLKTGFTDEAGSCFAGTGIFDGRRNITVVIGVEVEGEDTINSRFDLTRELIERFN
ncbi:D-alanyl-D-alanine carboxypeptidase family protein [Sporosarcina limicola]|uniref:D-alanyl-D-alanine carboxypeptidase (Penicillin-binding protein 5/6) n=1 Tax=Sporosarcina limicola TaxID=34101 RepID=A0A927MEF6_9BACL|nr:D-alanyl-D-alanine carboxypeptidase family protein [Sporosarcina limicola]MBE1553234.1 D-alanyl-D-alanine carboxypeptidase (penicillin-binding protein 5/6) [Sporosarcina limicola]